MELSSLPMPMHAPLKKTLNDKPHLLLNVHDIFVYQYSTDIVSRNVFFMAQHGSRPM